LLLVVLAVVLMVLMVLAVLRKTMMMKKTPTAGDSIVDRVLVRWCSCVHRPS